MDTDAGLACRAYIDIETTGFSPHADELTVVGICLERGRSREVIQLHDGTLSCENVIDAVRGANTIYSYNGARFDLPFIRSKLGVDLACEFDHCDLMHHCWNHDLWGGQKAVECQLGISRETVGIEGADAVDLWWDYKNNGSNQALRTLLKYNAEDVTNLVAIRRKLRVR